MKKALLCLILILSLLLCACSGKGEFSLHGDELLAVGGRVCNWAEAEMHILAQCARYSTSYGKDIWRVELAQGRFESYIRHGLLDYLKMLFLSDYGAEKAGIGLSNAEQSAVSRAAAAYIQALGEEGQSKTGITKSVAEEAFTRFARAQIFYRQTMVDGQVEVSDEEARVMALEIIEIEHRVGYGQTRTIQEELSAGKSVSEVLRGLEGVSTRKENVTRGMYPQEVEVIAFALKQDQWSPIISLDTSYILVRCLSSYVAEATAQHKAQMEKEVRESNLMQVMENLAEEVQLIYNPYRWEAWTMEQFEALPQVNFFDYTGELEK